VPPRPVDPERERIRLESWIDPEVAFAAVARDASHAFWLDAGADAVDGWSWLGTGEPEHDDTAVRRVLPGGGEPDADGIRFRGGWVGWWDYDAAAVRAGAPAAEHDPRGGRWMRVDSLLAFDHRGRRVWALGPEAPRLAEMVLSAAPIEAVDLPVRREARARDTPARYRELIARCQRHIRDGDAYQLCLTTRFEVAGDIDADAAHRRLRRATASHHGGIVRHDGTTLVSATPERFLEVRGGRATTRPIKGTRPRGASEAEDRALAQELAADVKERAENVMIVDLVRNDLSRVCVPGSVGVDRLLEVETYPAVHQLVSTVSGTLAPGVTIGDLVDATFPAGSMTGAPKLSAMTILHTLERGPRGVYSGCFGWVGDDGAADLAMVIRSILVSAGGASVGAGGGITWRSDPAAEVAEVGLKARAPLAAIGAEPPPGW
jgi:para-aminobenzoate synthetase component I